MQCSGRYYLFRSCWNKISIRIRVYVWNICYFFYFYFCLSSCSLLSDADGAATLFYSRFSWPGFPYIRYTVSHHKSKIFPVDRTLHLRYISLLCIYATLCNTSCIYKYIWYLCNNIGWYKFLFIYVRINKYGLLENFTNIK